MLRVKGEAKIEQLATQASDAAIQVQWTAPSAHCVQAHLPPSQRQGFFSGLTDLPEDSKMSEDLKGKGAKMSVPAGSLKVRTPTPVLARTYALAVGAWQERRGCDALVPG